jgi:two-component system, chemotaxis family, response regulator WspR
METVSTQQPGVVESRAVVLLVDDQQFMVEAIRRMLADEKDIELHACTDPKLAEQTAMEVLPTVILQDLMMDDTDGMTLVEQYRSNSALRDVPVVMLSAMEEPETKVKAFQVGANDYVVKLPSALELAARVRYHSSAYLAAQQRQAAFRALVEGQRALKARNAEIERQKQLLEEQAHMLERANQELAESAFSDALTGLRNRRYFKTYIEPELRDWHPLDPQAENGERREIGDDLVLYLFDLDHFKQINDTYGHDAGDVVLVEVAKRLKQTVRAGDSVMRWGGEEFMVVSRGVARDNGGGLAERIMGALANEPVRIPSGHELRVTASIGWAAYPWSRSEPNKVSQEDIQFMADSAVYISKRTGRNRAIGVIAPNGEWPAHVRKAGKEAPDQLQAEHDKSVCLIETLGPAKPEA